MKTRRVGQVRRDGDQAEALDQCQQLSGREMRRSISPRGQNRGYI